MLQVLLVDDEIAVTNSIRRFVDWNALGLNLAAVAQSGAQALKYIQENTVDIVITDIRMPDVDGLSLCQQIVQLNRNIPIIIISGFPEFSYAQKALSYGVIGYCLKPVEYAELSRYLRLAIQRLSHYSRSSNFDDLLDAIHQNNVPEIANQLSSWGFTLEKYYLATSSSSLPVLRSSATVLAVQLGYKRFGYLSTKPIDPEALSREFERTRCKGLSCCPEPVAIRKLAAVLKQLSNAALQYFFDSSRVISPLRSGPRRVPLYPEIAKSVQEGNTSMVIRLLNQLKTFPPDTFSLSAAWNLYDLLITSEQYSSVLAVDDVYNQEQMVLLFHSFHAMLDVLCDRLRGNQKENEPARISNNAFLYMVRYIDQHLTQDCSLQRLATEMNMNANYLGQVFKRETGKTYTQYITELRINRAKSMLVNGDMSISDIGTALGFNDYFYFLKTFKRITGITPRQYQLEQNMPPLSPFENGD